MLYMGKDKHENEDLIRYALPEQDVWLHVDKLSSAHVYLRLTHGMTIDSIPESLLADAAQLVKANSIVGNKTNNITVIYTLASNLKKDGSMDVGQVSFHSDKKVKRTHVAERSNVIINRLNKTKKVVEVDHIAEQVEREKEQARLRRLEATERKKVELELSRQRKSEVESRSYANLHAEEDEDEAWERKQCEGSFDPSEDFM